MYSSALEIRNYYNEYKTVNNEINIYNLEIIFTIVYNLKIVHLFNCITSFFKNIFIYHTSLYYHKFI